MTSETTNIRIGALTSIALALAGCSAGATGTLALTLSGEQAAVEGWPFTADGETIAFVDGWSLDVHHVYVSLTDVSLSGSDGASAGLGLDRIVADLADGDLEAWRAEEVLARRWESLSYTIAPPSSGARAVGSVTATDVERLTAAGVSLLIAATATHPTHGIYELELGLPLIVHSERCESPDGTDGVLVPASGTVEAQLTFHLDHVFFDSLADDGELRFDAWAGAAGDDGRITLEDLASQPLSDLRAPDGTPLRDAGGALVFYDPASSPLESPDLRSFVMAASTTVGHFDGEGHCDYRVE